MKMERDSGPKAPAQGGLPKPSHLLSLDHESPLLMMAENPNLPTSRGPLAGFCLVRGNLEEEEEGNE